MPQTQSEYGHLIADYVLLYVVCLYIGAGLALGLVDYLPPCSHISPTAPPDYTLLVANNAHWGSY